MTQPSDKPEEKKEVAAEADTAKQDKTAKPGNNQAKTKHQDKAKQHAKESADQAKAVESAKTAAQQSTAEQPQPAADKKDKPTERKPSEATSASSSGAKGIAIVALILSLGGLAAGGWSIMQMQTAADLNLQQQQQLADMREQAASMQEQATDLATREQQLKQQLAQLPTASSLQQDRDLLADLQAEQQQLAQRLETVLGASRQDWRLAEAEHLLRMASLRLTALHDTTSARFLLEAADLILMEQDDPAAFAAREQLAHSIVALKTDKGLDRTGLFVQLGALHKLTSQLTALAPEFSQGQSTQDKSGRWGQWWDEVSRYVRIDFNADQQIQPLLAGESLTQVRLAIGLALEQAQWAALNGATEVYQQALQQALDILNNHFDSTDQQVIAIAEQINALFEQKVHQELPDLNTALITLQAYINSRSTPQDNTAEESN
ncbi:MAG TPA: uroporphyrinogen-III C-methyltransferase [Thiopseudomonas sp.]|nr:uroporphyrinogen-III C-methyltransferase [Thiopseudomonas sp.]